MRYINSIKSYLLTRKFQNIIIFFLMTIFIEKSLYSSEEMSSCKARFTLSALKKDKSSDFLYRIVKVKKLKFDKKGFLLQQGKKVVPDGSKVHNIDKSFNAISLPLVAPSEWETIATALRWDHKLKERSTFILLRIRRSKIRNLKNRRHSLLREGEFFGEVHKNAIESAYLFGWEQTNQLPDIPKETYAAWPVICSRTHGFTPKVKRIISISH